MVIARPEHGVLRLRMSWEEYLRLPEDLHAEFVDGEVLVNPPPSARHGRTVFLLCKVLDAALPDLVVIPESGVHLPENRLRGPDVVVVKTFPETTWVEQVPVLVVEVLSPSTRSEDLIRKSAEYAGAGIGQYWVADPGNNRLEVFGNVSGEWQLLLRLDDARTVGSVEVTGQQVLLDLADLELE